MHVLFSLIGPGSLLAFIACVAVASYAQNLTGFAFSLILLGLLAVLRIVPIADASNAATLLTLFNAWSYVRLHKPKPPWRLMRPALVASEVGVLAGVLLLGWLSHGTGLEWLRAILGVSILACAVLLVVQTQAQPAVSPPGSFAVAGGLSGVLGGLFSASGPPLVFHMYRQPMDPLLIRASLLVIFASNSAVRLVLVGASGQFSTLSLVLAACAAPVVYAVGRFNYRYPVKMSPRDLRRLVAALLTVAGGSLLFSAGKALLAASQQLP